MCKTKCYFSLSQLEVAPDTVMSLSFPVLRVAYCASHVSARSIQQLVTSSGPMSPHSVTVAMRPAKLLFDYYTACRDKLKRRDGRGSPEADCCTFVAACFRGLARLRVAGPTYLKHLEPASTL